MQARNSLATSIRSLTSALASFATHQDTLHRMHSQICTLLGSGSVIRYFHHKYSHLFPSDTLENYFLLLDTLSSEPSVIPLTEHVMEALRKISGASDVSPSLYLAGLLAMPLRFTKDQDDLPHITKAGLHLLYTPPSSVPYTSPFCAYGITHLARSPTNQLRNKPKSRQLSNVDISLPHDPLHLTHVGFNESTGEFTGLPKEWQELFPRWYALKLREKDDQSAI